RLPTSLQWVRLWKAPRHLGAFIGALVAYPSAHILLGASLHPFVTEVAGQPAAWTVWHTIGALAAAHALGALAIFAPAGVGVREGVLVSALSQVLPIEQAVWFAVTTRVITLLVDLVLCIAAITVARVMRGPPR